MMNQIYIRKRHFLASSILMALAIPVYAQQAADSSGAQEQAIERITVTSRKRVETLVEVPMNVTSVSAIEISDRNLLNKDDLFRTLAGAATPTGTLILRGLSGGNGAAPSTTSSFTDDIPFDFRDLYDIEAVEVLRGPQGTLWGSNAIGGTVRVITQKPRLDTFEVLSSVQSKSTKNIDGLDLQAWGAINIPLITDTLALRVTGHGSKKPGTIVNANTGIQREVEDQYTRTQLLWKLNDDTSFNFGYYNVQRSTTGYGMSDLAQPAAHITVANTTVNPDALNGYDVSYNSRPCEPGKNRAACFGNTTNTHNAKYLIWESLDNWSESETDLITLTGHFDNVLNLADITYSGSYRQLQSDSLENWSRLDMNDVVKTWMINHSKSSRVTHEFRIQDIGKHENLKWTVGAFYDKSWQGFTPNTQWQYHESDDSSIAVFTDRTDYNLSDNDEPPFMFWSDWWGAEGIYNVGQLGETLYGDRSKNYNMYYNGSFTKEIAYFGELSYTIKTANIGSFEVTAGIRYYDLSDYASFGYSGVWEGPGGRQVVSEGDESGNRKKLSVAWLPDSGNYSVYALYSEGYRPGGNNPSLANACRNDEYAAAFQERYTSDSIDNYEIGYKANFSKLQFAAAIYQIDWDDVWASVYMPSCGFSYTANAAKARSRGIEWESKYRLANELDIIFNASYTNAEILSDVAALGAKKGQDMTQVPKYNAYIGLDKGFQFYNKPANIRLDIEAYGEYKAHFNARTDGSDTSRSYEKVNLSGRIELNDNTKLSLFINNLFDKEIEQYKQARSRGDNITNNLNVLYAPERSFTVRLDYTFL